MKNRLPSPRRECRKDDEKSYRDRRDLERERGCVVGVEWVAAKNDLQCVRYSIVIIVGVLGVVESVVVGIKREKVVAVGYSVGVVIRVVHVVNAVVIGIQRERVLVIGYSVAVVVRVNGVVNAIAVCIGSCAKTVL